jgi:hypothetical protein
MIFLLMWFAALRAIVPDAIAQRAALSGNDALLNGNHTYTHFNPMVGATYKLTPNLISCALMDQRRLLRSRGSGCRVYVSSSCR